MALKNSDLTVKVDKILIQDVTYSQSKIGQYKTDELKDFFNVIFRTAIPAVNQIASIEMKKFIIPSQFLGFVVIKDATFVPKDGYLAIQVAPEFKKYN